MSLTDYINKDLVSLISSYLPEHKPYLPILNEDKNLETLIKYHKKLSSKGLKPVAIAYGFDYELILLSNGTVMAIGWNHYGQLGLPEEYIGELTLIPNILNAVKIACGSSHSLILLADGSVLGAGSNNNGQLGMNLTHNIDQFTPLTSVHTDIHISNAIDITCDNNYSLVLLRDIISPGYNVLYTGNLHKLKHVRQFHGLYTDEITRVKNATSIACSRDHVLILKNDNTLIESDINSGSFKQVATKFNAQIKDICVGNNHSLLLFNDGTIMGKGDNKHDQLGLWFIKEVKEYTVIPTSFNVSQIICGSNSSVLVSESSNKSGAKQHNETYIMGITNLVNKDYEYPTINTFTPLKQSNQNPELWSIL